MNFFFIKLVFMIIIVTNVTACGVKSMPNVPAGGTYPAQYPPRFIPIEVIPRVLKQNNPSAPVVQDTNEFWQYPNTPPTK